MLADAGIETLGFHSWLTFVDAASRLSAPLGGRSTAGSTGPLAVYSRLHAR
jgi:hypothetical protein